MTRHIAAAPSSGVSPSSSALELKAMGTKPSAALVAAVFATAIVSMMSAVYFGGNGQLPLAMTGTGLFVILGGVGFELARRRS